MVWKLEMHIIPLDLVHMDVCGPIPIRTLGGALYFATFIDDATREVWVYPTKGKEDVYIPLS